MNSGSRFLPSANFSIIRGAGTVSQRRRGGDYLKLSPVNATILSIRMLNEPHCDLEPDVLRFPVSLLTAGALVGAILESLMLKYEYEAGWRGEVARRRRPGRVSKYAATSVLQLRQKREMRAEREAEGVIQDIQAVLGITDVSYCPFTRYLEGYP